MSSEKTEEGFERIECQSCGAWEEVGGEITVETLEADDWLFEGPEGNRIYCDVCHRNMYPNDFEDE